MSIHQQLAGALAAVSLVLLAFFPANFTVAVSFIAAIVLYGFVSFLESRSDDRVSQFEAEIKDLKEKMNTLMLANGLRR